MNKYLKPTNYWRKFIYYFDVWDQRKINHLVNKKQSITHNGIEMKFCVPNALNRYRVKTFSTDYTYEMVLVNANNKVQNIMVKIISFKSQQALETRHESVNEKSALVFPISQLLEEVRVVITSRMVMARPIIFYA